MSKKVFLVGNSAFTILNFRKELIEELNRLNLDVSVICPPTCHLMIDKNIEEEFSKVNARFIPVTIDRAGINVFKDLCYFIKLFFIYKKSSPSLVINYTVKPTIYSSLAARFAGVENITSNITGIGFSFTSESFKGKLSRFIVSSLYKLCLGFNKVVFFQNPDDKKFFIHNNYVKSDLCVVLNGSGVDVSKFKRNSVLPIDVSFIFVGRLLKDKGIIEFINAAKKVKAIHKNVQFNIVGQIDDNPECISKHKFLSCIEDGTINYIGPVKDIRPVLENNKIFVLPSYREGTPRSTLEAMSMGMPIITTDAPGCKETVVNGYNGFMVPIKDSESLYLRMLELLSDHDLALFFGSNSRKLAKSRYDVNLIVKKIIVHLELNY